MIAPEFLPRILFQIARQYSVQYLSQFKICRKSHAIENRFHISILGATKSMNLEEAAAKEAAEKIVQERYVVKRVLLALKQKVDADSVFDPLWISRRVQTEASMQKHVYITAINGTNRDWV
jgi:hypothetical protein